MAYSELIKNFNKIRDYMRDFYVYGFKSRDDYTKKSARSYDDEKRRIESWLGNYMKFHQTVDGKNVFLSIDSRATRHNPLYKASGLIEEESISGLVPWRVALGNDRKIIGDFAEYIIDRLEKAKERIEILESIKWAQEHQNQVYYIVEHALDSIDAKIQIMQQFKFSENQAQAIIDMRVRAFSVDEREKIANELQEIFEWIKHFPEL